MFKKILALLCVTLLLGNVAVAEGMGGSSAIEIRGYSEDEGYVYVEIGYYPYESSGVSRPVLWRVLNVEDNVATLRSEYALDVYRGNRYTTADSVQGVFFYKTVWERGCILSNSIPTKYDLCIEENGYSSNSGADESRKVKPTPYVAAQGVPMENGYVSYWTTDGDRISYVTPTGGFIPVNRAMTLAVVPQINVCVDELGLDAGSGTRKDPYYSTLSRRNYWLETNMSFIFAENNLKVNNPDHKEISVYTGPGVDYYCPEGAVLRMDQTNVTVRSREDNWLLIEYVVGNATSKQYKTGYVYAYDLLNKNKLSDQYAFYSVLPAYTLEGKTLRDVKLYDDYYMISQPLTVLAADTQITFLGYTWQENSPIAYIEANIYDQKARGFVPLDAVSLDDYDIRYLTMD